MIQIRKFINELCGDMGYSSYTNDYGNIYLKKIKTDDNFSFLTMAFLLLSLFRRSCHIYDVRRGVIREIPISKRSYITQCKTK